MKTIRLFLPLSLFVFAGTSVAEPATEYYADILPLIENNCVICHADSGVSFSFEDPESTYAFRAAIALAVADDRMPPWLAEPGHKEYVDDYSLSAHEKAVFAAWASAGYPRDAEQKKSNRSLLAPEPAVFEFDFSVELISGRSYLPNQDRKDDYRCFIVEWPYETDKYVTGFKAEPGNLRLAHHLVNYAITPESAHLIRKLSAEEDGDGYQCFGGPIPDRLANEDVRTKFEERHPDAMEQLQRDNFWLSHWAPGMYGVEFPENTGILIKPGSIVVVQMHYYSAFAPGESDKNTTMNFQIADSVEKPSVNYPLTKNAWLGARRNNSLVVPEGGQSTYQYSESFERISQYASHALHIDATDIEALELQSANVHMHAFGASGNTSIIDGDGKKQMLLNIPRWDLNWQRDFTFAEAVRIEQDELASNRLVIECTFANHTEELVYGGWGSDDEMCINFSYVSVVLRKNDAVAAR